MSSPFSREGISVGPDGIRRYDGLPASLVELLRATVARGAGAEAVVETGGGPRLTYRQLWELVGSGLALVAGTAAVVASPRRVPLR